MKQKSREGNIMKFRNIFIFCLVLAGMMLPCAAEETPQAIVQADKPPIQFKLIRGEQYQLCKDYVDMLNKTQYTEIPVCERTMLPEFKKFRAVQWKEITDKEDVRRLVIEKIRLQGLSGLPGLTNPEQDKMKTIKNIHKAESEMNAGKYHPVYESKIDLDHDGKNEVVYRFESVITPVKKSCNKFVTYLVVKQGVDGDDKYMYMREGYYRSIMLSLGFDRIFYYDGRSYVDYWDVSRLEVAEIDKRSNAVCSVNVSQ